MCADAEMARDDSDRIVALTEEIGRLARSAGTAGSKAVITAPQLRGMIRARRRRSSYFEAELFGEPAWDIMLDLLAARLEGKQVSVSSVSLSAGLSQSTGLRWITRLTECGLLIRKADPEDGRRINVELSDEAAAQMTNCLLSGHCPSQFIM